MNRISQLLTLEDNTKYSRAATRIINDIDTIAREGINRRITVVKDVERNSPSFSNTAITGKLKKRFSPNREIAENGLYVNRFNMSDVYSAYVGESLIKFATDKYAEACVRNGHYIDSKNPSVVQYLNKRFKEFQIVSGTTNDELITDFMVSCILYGNVPLVRHRQEDASSGNIYTRWDGKTMNPIASLYTEDFRKILLGEGPSGRMRYVRLSTNVDEININILNPSLFTIPKNEACRTPLLTPWYLSAMHAFGNIFRISSKRQRDYIIYEEDDLSHIRYHHVPGEKIAMPPFWPTLNDIDSLRRIEENIELLVYQYGHPILHSSIGDDKSKGDDTEIANVVNKLENMEGNGFIVTDNRVMIKMVGAESAALRLDAYLSYFYKRVLTGLWLSEVSVGSGDTANRSTANTLDKLSQEKVVELQNTFANGIQPVLFELLAEAGAKMSWILKPENIPSFVFRPVDVEGLIKKEAHTLTKWQANMLTEDEMRRELGKEPLTTQEQKRTYTYMHQIPLAQSKATMPGATTSSAKVTQKTLRPANQYGKKSGPSQSQNS